MDPLPPPKDGCIFCRIVADRARAHRIWEDDDCLVFMDLFPAAEGHTLIIPKPHWENLFETPTAHLERIIRLSKPLAFALRTALEPDGISVFQLNGAAAGQTVFHYHMHLIPRRHGMPLHIHGRRQADRAELDRLAARIREALPQELEAGAGAASA